MNLEDLELIKVVAPLLQPHHIAAIGSIANAITATFFLMLSIGLEKLYKMTKSDEVLRLLLGFLMLSISGFLGVAMFLTASLRLIASLYTSTATFAFSGLLLIFLAAEEAGEGRELSIFPLIFLFFSVDVATGVVGLLATVKSNSWARLGLALLSLSFILRGGGVLLIRFSSWSFLLLLAEILRSLSAAFLAVYYVVEVLVPGEKKV